MLAAIPLLIFPVAAYAALALTWGGGLYAAGAHERMSRPLFQFITAGGGVWPVSAADLILAVTLIVGFIELLKGLGNRRIAIVNHTLSIVLFVGCLAAMLLAPAFANSTFFLITLVVLLDLAAGFIVTLGQADADTPTG
jgi:hypothetical protein